MGALLKIYTKKNLRAEGLCPCYLDGDRAPVDHRPCKSPYNNGHARAHKKYVYKYMYVNSIYTIYIGISLSPAPSIHIHRYDVTYL